MKYFFNMKSDNINISKSPAMHEAVYLYLCALHKRDASFKFRVIDRVDPEKKLWFHNKDSGILISFWALNGTGEAPAIYLLIKDVKEVSGSIRQNQPALSIRLDKKVEEEIQSYCERMAAILHFSKGYHPNNWYDYFGTATENPIATIEYFIQTYKKEIDDYISENPAPGAMGFISDDDFKQSLDYIDEERAKWLTSEIQAESNSILEDFRLHQVQDKEHLPCCISRVYVSNFQGIKALTVEPLPLNARWCFLTGENAFGKTSLLRAIAKGLAGNEQQVVKTGNETTIWINGFNQKGPFRNSLKEGDEAIAQIPLATYGVARFQLSASNMDVSDRSKQKTYSLFYDDGLLINIEQELITAYAYNKPRFEGMRDIFLSIVPNLQDIVIDNSNGSPKVRYCEQDDEQRPYGQVSLNDLAAGYRGVFTMIGDMMLRLHDGTSPLSEIVGIVLIDEIDAHLHPKYQYKLPTLLSKVFPKVQFIATTHSPIPIMGLPSDNKPVILTLYRDADEGITVDRKDDDFDLRQLNVSALLTSPVFGFQDILARGASPKEINTADTFLEVEKVAQIKKRLAELRSAGKIQ